MRCHLRAGRDVNVLDGFAEAQLDLLDLQIDLDQALDHHIEARRGLSQTGGQDLA